MIAVVTRSLPIAVTLAALGWAGVAHGQSTEPAAAEFRDGRWQTIRPAAPTVVAPDPELDHVQQLIDARDGEAALALGLRWVKSHAKSAPQRDRALYQVAQSLVQADDWIKAYYYLDELMDEYPASPLFGPAMEGQYRIADGFLNGHKRLTFGLPIVDAEDEAVEMLFRLQQRSPGSPLAERALLRTADYYYADADYDLAHDAYQFYAKQYPRSDRTPQAKLRAAFASLAQFRGPRYDATPMLEARTQLADFALAYPALSAEENVPGILAKIDEELAVKLYLQADYYRRTGAGVAAVYVYRYLVLTYPRSTQAADARVALSTMPAKALAGPMPQAGRPYVPPTVPKPKVLIP